MVFRVNFARYSVIKTHYGGKQQSFLRKKVTTVICNKINRITVISNLVRLLLRYQEVLKEIFLKCLQSALIWFYFTMKMFQFSLSKIHEKGTSVYLNIPSTITSTTTFFYRKRLCFINPPLLRGPFLLGQVVLRIYFT